MKKITISLILILFVAGSTFSQFYPTSPLIGGGYINCMFVKGTEVFAGTQTGGIFKTTNNGDNWDQVNNGLVSQLIYTVAGINNTLFAGTSAGLYRSTDNGSLWVLMNYGAAYAVTALTVNGTDIYLGTIIGNLYKSTNNGSNWTVFANNITGKVISILFFNGLIYAAADGSGVHASSNNGANWSVISAAYTYAKVLFPTGGVVRLGSSNGGKKSTSPMGYFADDIPWINYVLGYASAGNYIIAGMSNGMFWSSDNGATWNDPGSGYLSGVYVWSMAQNSTFIFAGANGTVYRRPINQFTSLNNAGTEVPAEYSVSQNYPNPFNPETKINFSIPKSSGVLLVIYSQLGEKVAELVNQKLDAGNYEYSYNANGLASGIYYYKITAGDFTQTRKMILVK